MGQFDHLVPEAHRITQESGLITNENVGLVDPATQQAHQNRKEYKVTSISDDDITIARPLEQGEEVLAVKQNQVFAIGVIQDLADGYPADEILASRKNILGKK